MKQQRSNMYQPRTVRSRKQQMLKFFIWVVLVTFVVSVVGVAIVVVK